MGSNQNRVRLDLNNPTFQNHWLTLDKTECDQVTTTIRKLIRLSWQEIYRDHGLHWEKITSITPPHGIEAIYSIRITKSRRATAYRDGDFMRFLTIAPDHDATYGKK